MPALEYVEDKNPARQRSCIGGIKAFLDFIYGTQRQRSDKRPNGENERYEQMAVDYLKSQRDPVKDLIAWKKKSEMSPKTMRIYLGVVKEFLDINGSQLLKAQEEKLKQAYKGGDEVQIDAPDHGLIRSFLEHSDVRLKAIIHLGAATGMRIGEILSITEDSINRDLRMITLRAAWCKTKKGRVVFYNKEAEKALNEYLRVKEKYIERNNEKARLFSSKNENINRLAKDDGRIFPFNEVSINRSWNRTLKNSGLYKKDERGRATFHAHSLRQFFSTKMRKGGCPDSFVEKMLGHGGYLDMYKNFSKTDLQEEYEKFAGCLTIGSADDVRRTVNALAEKTIEVNEKVKKLEAEKEDLQRENRSFQERLALVEATRIDDVGDEIKALTKRNAELQGQIDEIMLHAGKFALSEEVVQQMVQQMLEAELAKINQNQKYPGKIATITKKK